MSVAAIQEPKMLASCALAEECKTHFWGNEPLMKLAFALAKTPDIDLQREFALLVHKELGLDYVLIGKLNTYSNMMQSTCLVAEGEVADNITYSLDGTPCARVMECRTKVYPENVAEKYPFDKLLVEMGVTGYAGTPLLSPEGEAVGIIVGLSKKPITNPQEIMDVLEFFRNRIMSSLCSQETLDRLNWITTEGTDGVWDWDILIGGTTISKRFSELLGYAPNEGPQDLAKFEERIHPEDLQRHIQQLHNHINEGAVYDLRLRLKTREGAYRWFRSRGKVRRNEEGHPVRMIGWLSDIHDFILEAQTHNSI